MHVKVLKCSTFVNNLPHIVQDKKHHLVGTLRVSFGGKGGGGGGEKKKGRKKRRGGKGGGEAGKEGGREIDLRRWKEGWRREED